MTNEEREAAAREWLEDTSAAVRNATDRDEEVKRLRNSELHGRMEWWSTLGDKYPDDAGLCGVTMWRRDWDWALRWREEEGWQVLDDDEGRPIADVHTEHHPMLSEIAGI